MKIPPLRGIDGQIVNSNQKQLIWPSIPHGGVILLTNQLEMISRLVMDPLIALLQNPSSMWYNLDFWKFPGIFIPLGGGITQSL